MTTAIQQTERITFTEEQIGLVKRTICVGATDDELKLFLSQCQRTGLDPFARQIHAVKRWDNRAKREVMSIQVGIDGFRLVAERTGETDGQDGPLWCGEDGAWKDVWLSKDSPSACKVTVFRRNQSRGYVGIATWAEYAQRGKEGQLIGLWAKMPSVMLAKCAEALALRKAFPADLSGLYSPEEMPATVVEVEAHEHEPEPEPEPAKQLPAPTPPPKQVDPRRDSLGHEMKRTGWTWQMCMIQLDAMFPEDPVGYGPSTKFGDIEHDALDALITHLKLQSDATAKG